MPDSPGGSTIVLEETRGAREAADPTAGGDGNGIRRVLLLDPQALVRQTLRAALETRPGFRIVAESWSTTEAISAATALRPDLILVSAGLDRADVLRAIALFRERVPECRVVLIGGESDSAAALAALDAGASGYFPKASSFAELVEAIRRAGQVLLPRSMLQGLLEHLLQQRGEELQALRKVSQLTVRERQVLSCMARGEGNERIGEDLVISPHTARTHVQNILSKLGLHSRLEAVAFVRRLGRHAELLRPPG